MVVDEIAEYVKAKGIKQSVIAEAIGITPQAMSDTLRGERALKAEEFVDICAFLEVPMSKFVNRNQ
jgi:transcriptional regulator with XRE-family HTH domain